MMLRASSLRLAGAALLSLAIAAPAIAAGDPPSVTSASDQAGATAAPKKERKICKTAEATESRMSPARICKTAAEWHADQASGPDMNDMKTAGGGKVH
jgi:hypothetical protein